MLIEKRRQGALTPWLRQQQWLAGKSAKPGTTATLTLRLTRRASLLVQCCWYTRLSWNTQIGVRIDKRAESSGRVADGTLGPNHAPTTVHHHCVTHCATVCHCVPYHCATVHHHCAPHIVPRCATVCYTVLCHSVRYHRRFLELAACRPTTTPGWGRRVDVATE